MTQKQNLSILRAIGVRAAQNKIKAWAVGGFARDRYLGKPTYDIDICVEGDIKPLVTFCAQKYNAKAQYFAAFGTARAAFPGGHGGLKIDFVRCRREVYPKPAALPRVFPAALHDDLYRRDFTANAWALSLLPGEFLQSYDLFAAQNAIDKKQIQILHAKSFEDDPTRIFRALRFAGRFGWRLEVQTAQLLRAAVQGGFINLLSRERIRQELLKILEEKNPAPVFKLMARYKVAAAVYPGLKYPAAAAKVADVTGRLTMLALALGKAGPDFLKSLNLQRDMHTAALAPVAFYLGKEALAKPLPSAQQKLIKLFAPKLPPGALRALKTTPSALQKRGLNGPALGAALKAAARAQFKAR